MHQCAHTANALCESPRISRIPAAQNDFDAANHRAGRPRFGNVISIHLCFDTQMTLDSGYRIYDDTIVHIHSYLLLFSIQPN
jgi:hypothetical protein